jgi:hypothetical protein
MAQDSNKRADVKEAAKKYVDGQLAILRKHGSVKSVSKREIDSMVNQVVKATVK